MLDEYKNLIANRWKTCRRGGTFDDENPSERGSVIARFQASGPEDMTEAIDAAARSLAGWRKTRLEERQQRVEAFLDLLQEAREELARIVTLENGKTIRESRAEIDSALAEGRYHLRQVSGFQGHTGQLSSDQMSAWVQYHPVGVVGVISPWNFPVNVMCRKTLPALLTGNTVVFKPASYTPWSGVFMASLLERAGFPEGTFNCVTGLGARVGEALLRDPRVRAISFTGSTEVGKRIHLLAAESLIRTQLELGGKNALIVMDDAAIDRAVDAAMLAGFACAGQWCTSTSRLLLHSAIATAFVEKLVARCESHTVGNPMDEFSDMGPVAGPSQYQSICAAIERGIIGGARMLTGGRMTGAIGDKGYFIRPTVLAGVSPEMWVFQEEIFGPVLTVTEFDSLDQALRLANHSIYGLSSAIFTANIAAAQKYTTEIETGLAHVNMHSGFKDPALPFGGWKLSGHGLPENSRTGLEFFVDRKAVYFQGT